MAFRFISSAGSVHEPAVLNLPASGVIWPGSLVSYSLAEGLGDSTLGQVVSAGVASLTAGSTTTNIVGVALDYVQGASNTFVRVIPFVPGQLWEADCVNAVSTSNLFLRHQIADERNIRNVTRVSETSSAGVFLAYAITGLTTGSGKLIGTFLQRVSVFGKDGVTPTT